MMSEITVIVEIARTVLSNLFKSLPSTCTFKGAIKQVILLQRHANYILDCLKLFGELENLYFIFLFLNM